MHSASVCLYLCLPKIAECFSAQVVVKALEGKYWKLSRFTHFYTEKKDVKETHSKNYYNTEQASAKNMWVREFSFIHKNRLKCKKHKRVKSVQIEPSMWKRLDSNVARNFFCCIFSFLDLMWKVFCLLSLLPFLHFDGKNFWII